MNEPADWSAAQALRRRANWSHDDARSQFGREGEGVQMTPELAAKIRAVYAQHARVKLEGPEG